MTESSLTTGTRKQRVLFKCITRDASPVVLSGDLPELGKWDLAEALATHSQARPQGGFEWSAQIELPLGHTIEYKFVKKTDHGPRWESGNNHRITVIPGASHAGRGFSGMSIVDKQSQLNRSTRGQWNLYASHRQELERLLVPARPGGRICVLGAGNLQVDLDLQWLTQVYREVHLVEHRWPGRLDPCRKISESRRLGKTAAAWFDRPDRPGRPPGNLDKNPASARRDRNLHAPGGRAAGQAGGGTGRAV